MWGGFKRIYQVSLLSSIAGASLPATGLAASSRCAIAYPLMAKPRSLTVDEMSLGLALSSSTSSLRLLIPIRK
jgi:ABC-type branched-subunit amino acid transport system ATPase component